jgi:dTDP-4-dehydrorhamnose reductase
MKIGIVGAAGQLGQEFSQLERKGLTFFRYDKAQFDIVEKTEVEKALQRDRPDVVIHVAAFTAVDRAESERDIAFAVNELGSQNVALACRTLQVPLLSVSTDYVFGGPLQVGVRKPFGEDCSCDPCNIYGKSKLAGERAHASARALLKIH